jgi:flagellar L-ring protein precursor FlgH
VNTPNCFWAPLFLAWLAAAPAGAQSLLDDVPDLEVRSQVFLSPYGQPRKEPFKQYDHITVIVRERSRASVSADLRSDRRTRMEDRLSDFVKLNSSDGGLPRLEPVQPNLEINLDARMREENAAGTKREGIIEDTITAVVVDVKENGDLVVEGMKDRKINGEQETIRISGIVSPQSIAQDRTVRADKIAHLQVAYEGSGSVGDKAEPGFLGKILGALWPF